MDEIFIGPGARREARGEAAREDAVEREGEPFDRERPVARKRDHLSARVDARVGPSRAGDLDRPAEKAGNGALDLARDRARRRLKLEAAELGAVVLDDDPIGRSVRARPQSAPGRDVSRRGRADRPTRSRPSDPARPDYAT